jgi:hypothetical protein
VLGCAIVALLASGITSVAFKELSADESWDSRVKPLADFVASERNLEFDHPVPVEFLSDEEFSEAVTEDGEGLSEADQEEAEQFSRLFRAVGLVAGDMDMADMGNELVDEGVLALYDPESKRVLVRGTEITPKLQATLVHELTHALQDQNFDLSKIDDLETSGEQLGYRALAEGDADRIEMAYVDDLDSSEEDEYFEASDEEPDLDSVPPALIAYFSAPYALGDPFVALIDERDGNEGVDDSFEDPPTSEENLLDPFTYFDGDDPRPVDEPEIGDGEEEFDSGDWGALTWLLMLGARLDPHAALKAVDGWGGDSYVAFERDGTTCVRIAYVGDTPADTAEMADALDEWEEAMPPGAASVRRSDQTILVDACDPGAETDAAFAPDDADILVLPAARAGITWEFLSDGASEETARCIGERIVESSSIEELSDPEAAAENSDIEERVGQIIDEC